MFKKIDLKIVVCE